MFIQLTTDGAGLNLSQPPYDTEGATISLLGNKGSGKSNTQAVIAESFHDNGIPFIFYDPNGDAASLRTLGDDVIVIGDPNDPEPLRRAHYPFAVIRHEAKDFIRMVLTEGYSLVVDMREREEMFAEDDEEGHPLAIFSALVNEHFRQAGRLRTPCGVFIDEGQVFAPQSRLNKFEKLSLRAVRRVGHDGRKRGMVLCIATQHATEINKSVIRGANIQMFGKMTHFPDFDAIKHYLPPGWNHPKHSFAKMRKLRSGEVMMVSPGTWGVIQIKRRRTPDLGKTPAFKPVCRTQRPSIKTHLQLPLFSRGGNR